jgi:biopolymer transport protein ExbD
MKRFSKSTHGAVAELNITPLLDLAWVLLVVFILTTTAALQGIEVQLPKSTPNSTTIDENKVRAISIKRTGEVFLDDQKVEVGELEGILRDLKKAKGSDFPMIIRGDEHVEYKYVVAVLDALQKVPIEDVGLATKLLTDSGS